MFNQTVFGLDSSVQNSTANNSTSNIPIDLAPHQITKSFNEFTVLINDQISNNPLSLFILQNMEKQKLEQSQPQKISAKVDPLSNTRKLANESLQNDLRSMEKESVYNSPQVAFSRFINTVDNSVKPIFWGQFNFTSNLHDEGLKAKFVSLKNGGTSLDATKEFQRKASSSRSDIIQINQDLNMKYSNSSKIIQSHFDKNGKLPRPNG
ncbi:hypothetical protein [Nitrosopumilus sp. S4]